MLLFIKRAVFILSAFKSLPPRCRPTALFRAPCCRLGLSRDKLCPLNCHVTSFSRSSRLVGYGKTYTTRASYFAVSHSDQLCKLYTLLHGCSYFKFIELCLLFVCLFVCLFETTCLNYAESLWAVLTACLDTYFVLKDNTILLNFAIFPCLILIK